MTKKNYDICPFCQTFQKLCESHITPKWLIRDRGPTQTFYLIAQGDPFKRSIPEGIKEYMLCRDCEDRMGVYDTYAAEFFRGAANWRLITPHGFRLWAVDDFDYPKLKLFFMSILWRAVVAKTPFFAAVKLDTAILKRLHDMLWFKDPGAKEDFTVRLNKRETTVNQLEKATVSPCRVTSPGGVPYFRFDLNEYQCQIKASLEPDESLKECWLGDRPPFHIYEGGVVPERNRQMAAIVQAQPKLLEDFREQRRLEREQRTP